MFDFSSDAEAGKMLDAMEENQDGFVELREWLQYCRKMMVGKLMGRIPIVLLATLTPLHTPEHTPILMWHTRSQPIIDPVNQIMSCYPAGTGVILPPASCSSHP